MNELIIYLTKSAIWSVILWGFYKIFLERETFFRFTRVVLLVGLLFIVAAPLLRFHYTVSGSGVTEVVSPTVLTESSNRFGIKSVLLFVYVAVATCIFARLLFFLGKMGCIIKRYGAPKIIHTSEFKGNFSLLGTIFMDTSSYTSPMEKEMILQHELAHIRQYHWVDLMVAHIVCTFLWFSPFAWLYLKAIRQNHEFLADAFVVGLGHSSLHYRVTIVNQQIGATVCSFAHSFSYRSANRIGMIGLTPSPPLKKASVLLLLPILGIFYVASAKPVYRQTSQPLDNAPAMVHFRREMISIPLEGDSRKVKIVSKGILFNTDSELLPLIEGGRKRGMVVIKDYSLK